MMKGKGKKGIKVAKKEANKRYGGKTQQRRKSQGGSIRRGGASFRWRSRRARGSILVDEYGFDCLLG